MAGWSCTAAFNRPKWVDASTRAPRSARRARAVSARAVPSCGSVPEPISSQSSRLSRSASSRNRFRWVEVGREARQRVLDGLLVAEVDEQAPHQGQPRVLPGRDVPAALRQQHQHAHRLHGHRLAARVGTADHQHAGLVGQLEVEGHQGVAAVGGGEGLDSSRGCRAAQRRRAAPRSRPAGVRHARGSSGRRAHAIDQQHQLAAQRERRLHGRPAGSDRAGCATPRRRWRGAARRDRWPGRPSRPARRRPSGRCGCGHARCRPILRRSPARRGRQKRSPRRVTSSAVVQPRRAASAMARLTDARTCRSRSRC